MSKLTRHKGSTLIELLVAMTITLVMVIAATYIYLGTRETQQAIERTSSATETATFAAQLIGQDLLNAGYYPAVSPPQSARFPGIQYMEKYPPSTWTPPGNSKPYKSGIFGCDGAKFNFVTATCNPTVAGSPDSIVINYFSYDPYNFGRFAGSARDCTGASILNDTANTVRANNSPVDKPTIYDKNLPPGLPLFISNRYALNMTTVQTDQKAESTMSLACSGNGRSPFGINDSAAYQPILLGLEDIQFVYGLQTPDTNSAPTRFFTATELEAMPLPLGETVSIWNLVTAVRVCVLSKTLAGPAKVSGSTTNQQTYLDCNDTAITPTATDKSIRRRHVQVFGLRNKLNQFY